MLLHFLSVSGLPISWACCCVRGAQTFCTSRHCGEMWFLILITSNEKTSVIPGMGISASVSTLSNPEKVIWELAETLLSRL